MRLLRRPYLPAAAVVLLLHAGLLLLLWLQPAARLSRQPEAASMRLRILRLPPPAGPSTPPAAAASIRAATAPWSRPAQAVPQAPVPTRAITAAPTAAIAASAPPALDLRLPLSGPQRSPAGHSSGHAALAAQMRTDPRANSPRLGLDERLALRWGTPCFVDELDAEGRPQRYPGRLVGLPITAQQISQGVAGNLGVGGQAPPVLTPVCQRS